MQPEVSRPADLPSDAEEWAQHRSAIQMLSEQYQVPAESVAALYERELSGIRQDALITTYLSIFVSRRVGALLRGLQPLGRQETSPISPPERPLQ